MTQNIDPVTERWLAQKVTREDNSYNDLVKLLYQCQQYGLDIVHPIVVCCVEQIHYRVSVQIGPPMRPEISFKNSFSLAQKLLEKY